MSYTIVLAENHNEANRYAKRAKLRKGQWRFPVSASALRGLRVAEIHELPSFAGRRDRHAILAELRYSRGKHIQVEMPGKLAEPAVDQGDGFGQQLSIDDVLHLTPVEADKALDANKLPGATPRELEVAYRYDRLRELEKPQWQRDLDLILEPEGWEPPESLTAEQVLALAANPDARGADVLEETRGEETGTTVEGEDSAPAAPKRRRSRCKDCGDLDFPETHACPVALRPPEPTPSAAVMWD